MPQLVKGGKWVFGWVKVDAFHHIVIPPEAWQEYGFQEGKQAIFLPASAPSGGFGISSQPLMDRSAVPFASRSIASTVFGDGVVCIPPEVGVYQGAMLLALRGSGLALGFIVKGLIFHEAILYPELQVFGA